MIYTQNKQQSLLCNVIKSFKKIINDYGPSVSENSDKVFFIVFFVKGVF